MINYKIDKVIIDASNLAEVIINLVIWQHSISNLIIRDCRLVFLSKFLLSNFISWALSKDFCLLFRPRLIARQKAK